MNPNEAVPRRSTPARFLVLGLVVALWSLLQVGSASAVTTKFSAGVGGVDLYVNEYGAFNLGVPGEADGLFYDGGGSPISAGNAGLALYLYGMGTSGIGQGVPFIPVSGPTIEAENATSRIVVTNFKLQNGGSDVLDIEQTILQSRNMPTVAVFYTLTNTYGDDLQLRPFLVGDLTLDSTNNAVASLQPELLPTTVMTVASTSSPRAIRLIPDPDPNSIQVGDWESVAQSNPGANLPYDALDTSPVTNPAFGIEWSDWWTGSTLPGGDLAEFSTTFTVAGSPVQGQTAVVQPVSGTVLIKTPGGSFQELESGQDIPIGSTIDTRQGTVRLTAARGQADQTAEFKYGIFRIQQKRASPLTTLRLTGALEGCGQQRSPRSTTSTAAAVRRGKGRTLWGSGKGKFRTQGKRGSGSVRGTTWQVTDRCDGSTRISSLKGRSQGRVDARDFGKPRKRIVLEPGQSYVARPGK